MTSQAIIIHFKTAWPIFLHVAVGNRFVIKVDTVCVSLLTLHNIFYLLQFFFFFSTLFFFFWVKCVWMILNQHNNFWLCHYDSEYIFLQSYIQEMLCCCVIVTVWSWCILSDQSSIWFISDLKTQIILKMLLTLVLSI